jgi:hypothetical protein
MKNTTETQETYIIWRNGGNLLVRQTERQAIAAARRYWQKDRSAEYLVTRNTLANDGSVLADEKIMTLYAKGDSR